MKPKQTASIFTESATAIKAILDLHFPEGSIVDLNFGLGVFYKKTPDRKVTGIDLKPTGSIIADNKNLPFEANSFDIAVIDPPYKRGDGQKYEARYGVAPKTETKVTWSYYAGIEECFRVARSGLIIKVQDGTDGHIFHARHFQLMERIKRDTGLDPHDIAFVGRKSVPNTMVRGTPHFFQQSISYFLIYKWQKTVNGFRRVRF